MRFASLVSTVDWYFYSVTTCTRQKQREVLPLRLHKSRKGQQDLLWNSSYINRGELVDVKEKSNYPYQALPPPRVLRSMVSSTTPARHIHLIEIKYCQDTRPGAQLEASQQQHSELCKQL
eukprot:1161484-Pelagomonas_calceolata.AAC.5